MPAPALQDRWGRYPNEEHYDCPHSPVHDRQCRPVPNGDRWENEGGHVIDYDEHGRHPDHLHYECPFPCHEFH